MIVLKNAQLVINTFVSFQYPVYYSYNLLTQKTKRCLKCESFDNKTKFFFFYFAGKLPVQKKVFWNDKSNA